MNTGIGKCVRELAESLHQEHIDFIEKEGFCNRCRTCYFNNPSEEKNILDK